MDYEIIFDGSHGNQDRDLLCTPKISVKRHDVPPEPKRTVYLARGGGALQRVEQALAQSPGTSTDVECRSGLSHGSVQAALYELRQMGVIKAKGSQKVNGMGRYETVYGLAEGA